MNTKKKAVIFIILLIVLLAVPAAHIRIISIPGETAVLFHNPFYQGSASVGSDIRVAFDEAGKSSDKLADITYIGTNCNGNYFQCTYQEADGAVSTYYAFDDGDLNSTVRAVVLW